jgi:hypothetical protein
MFATVLLLRTQINRKVQISDELRVAQETAESSHSADCTWSDKVDRVARIFANSRSLRFGAYIHAEIGLHSIIPSSVVQGAAIDRFLVAHVLAPREKCRCARSHRMP